MTLLLGLFGYLIDLLVLILPNGSLPFWSNISAFAPTCAQWLFAVDGLLPIAAYVSAVRWMFLVWMPGWMTFRISQWVWSKVPVVGS